MKQLSVYEQLTNADHLICLNRAQKRKQNPDNRFCFLLLCIIFYIQINLSNIR